jgi:hypothetical protein
LLFPSSLELGTKTKAKSTQSDERANGHYHQDDEEPNLVARLQTAIRYALKESGTFLRHIIIPFRSVTASSRSIGTIDDGITAVRGSSCSVDRFHSKAVVVVFTCSVVADLLSRARRDMDREL